MKFPFIFGIHCHQPAENFHWVVDDAIDMCYAPFLETAERFGNFRFAAHYSGWLLEYIRTSRKDVFKNLQKLSGDGRLEFFTGGFYEPVLSAIPSDDRKGQVEILSKYIKKHFGQEPEGLWLTERVWDPAIVPDMAEVGIKHIIVDDYHLISAGFSKESLRGYFKTEENGVPVNLFPIDMGLRYLTPFKPENDVIDYIKSARDRGVKLISCFDDGEKFGVWPKTYEWVYKNGWMERFLQAVEDDGEIEFIHYGEAAARFAPAGTAYLPITSYEEMGEWSLFADQAERFENMKEFLKNSPFAGDTEQFLKGSVWKNFLIKYPESNRLHKRTLDLSLRSRPYKKDKKFLDLLYRSQCNDSLWHGVFGGLYLPNLRDNAWAPLIEAENLYEKLSGTTFPQTEKRDADLDGFDEVYARRESFNVLFSAKDGGQMTAWELKDKNFNLLNVISRKKEAYHGKYTNAKPAEDSRESGSSSIHEQNYGISADISRKIAYDWYNKNCFIDHFTDSFDPESFEKCSFREFGDFANQPFQLEEAESKIIFSRTGGLYTDKGKLETEGRKIYDVRKSEIDFEISFKCKEEFPCVYVLEFNFHFADLKAVYLNGLSLEERGSLEGKTFSLKDPYLGKTLTLELAKAAKWGWFTIYTVSQSERGIDLTAQGLTVTAALPFKKSLSLKGALTLN